MSEEILKAIMKLFAIVAKERITDEERNNIREFLSLHLNQEAIASYMGLFENYVKEYKVEVKVTGDDLMQVDDQTLEFIDEWNSIIRISKEVNSALTITQKLFMVVKIIELVYSDGEISERQGNLLYYLGESLKIPQKHMVLLRKFVTGEDYDDLNDKNILIVDDGSGEFKSKGPMMEIKNITGLIAILRIPDLELYFLKYLGISVLYMNGVAVRSRKISVFPTGSTIRGNKINTVYYSDVVSRFIRNKSDAQVTLSAEHLFYHFRSGRAGLQNINLSETGGKLIGIMGASGSGKSTLLSVLNGSERPSSGRVIINTIDVHENPEKLQGFIGFVPQDDFLIAELTVYENLYYAAELCFSEDSPLEIQERVENILNSLGLSETRDLKVGSAMDKTISGGQRKRLNIGLELMREPSVLFVDEPTSGLSSRDSENIMDLLKELSFKGKMVFVVIHQPSSDIFKLFDSLLILDTGGFQIYYGNPVESVTYFRKLVNAVNKDQGACPECGNINPEQIFNIIETKIVNEFGRHTKTRKVSPGQWYQYFRENIKIQKTIHTSGKTESIQSIPGRINQLWVYLRRDFRTKLSNNQYVLINVLQAPLLALFIGLMVRYYDVIERKSAEYSFYANDNIPVYFFMSIIVALFMGLTVSAEEIFRDRMLLKREKFLHLSRFSYLGSKITVLFCISAFQTASFAIIGDFILELDGMEPRWWLILFSVSCFANLLGLNISATFNSAVTIYIIIPLLLIPQLLLSGVVITFDKFNPSLTTVDRVPWFGDLMASRWSFEAAMVTQFKDNPYEDEVFANNVKIAEAEYKKIYLLPRIESEFQFCFANLNRKFGEQSAEIEKSLLLGKEELKKEYTSFQQDIPDWLEKMNMQNFDSTTFMLAKQGIETMSAVYNKRIIEQIDKRQIILENLKSEGVSIDSLKLRFVNAEVSEIVKNTRSVHRIFEFENQLIRKYMPVYQITDNNHSWNFRTDFYAPFKPFLGFQIDTLYFNLSVIWTMTVFLYITLYYEVLKRFIDLFVPHYKRRNRMKAYI